MTNLNLRCDGCGQPASAEHTARRLQRLEWTTRFRPVHIGTLLLGAVAPQDDSEFIYSPSGGRDGEARTLLAATGITLDGKSAEVVLAEFQRGGFFLTHVLECPLEGQHDSAAQYIANRLPSVLTRIRRSLKPKRLAPISSALQQFLPELASAQLPCTLLLDAGRPFVLDREASAAASERLREALAARSSRAIV